ncbi:MAG TPA: ABC transporter permease subunit, partial [Phenylobacterium sp.]|nr:ABC transporter permease subunit [Phenylobacterium sp.]
TVRLAGVTTLLLLLLSTPLAWWLARSPSRWTAVVGAVVGLPLVLPPTVLGFYLLLALGPYSLFMAPLAPFGVRTLAFTFTGLVIGSLIYSLPFAVQPLRNVFVAIGDEPLESAVTLGARPLTIFTHVALPLAAPGYVTAAILVFAHTIGAIPGQTAVVSTEIFRLVESLAWEEAHRLAALLVAFGFAVILSLLLLERRFGAQAGGR